MATIALVLCAHSSTADPLHERHEDGIYVHADSGWEFPERIGEFARVELPYTIDGNDDVGVEYEYVVDSKRTLAIVEVFSTQSAAENARLDTAHAAMERGSGTLKEEQSFAIAAKPELHGTRRAYGDAASLYFLTFEQWVVNVRTSSSLEEPQRTRVLDAFVRGLPWASLGSDAGIH